MTLTELLQAIAFLDEKPLTQSEKDEKEKEIYSKFFDGKNRSDDLNSPDENLEELLVAVLYHVLSDETRKKLLDILCQNVRSTPFFKDANQIIPLIKVWPDDFDYFFSRASEKQRESIIEILNGDTLKSALTLDDTTSSVFIRNLINFGLRFEKFIVLFQDEKGFLNKGYFKKCILKWSLPKPGDEDLKAYKEFMEKLNDLLYTMNQALLFVPGEGKTTFEGVEFDSEGGNFLEEFSRVKNNYLALMQKELKDFSGGVLSFLSQEETDKVNKIVSELMKSSPSDKDDNRIVRLITNRTDRGAHAEGGRFHAEGLLLSDELFVGVDRGAASWKQKSGIRIWRRKHPRTQEEREFVSKVESFTDGGFCAVEGNKLDQRINEMDLEFLNIIKMSPQSSGNCTIATSKAFVLAAYYVAIRKTLKERDPSLTDQDLHDQAEPLARKIYKAFTRLHRLKEAKDYLVWIEARQHKNINMKILAKTIGCFGEEPSIKEIIEKNNLLDRLSLFPDALGLALQTAISKKNLALIQVLMSIDPSEDTKLKSLKLLKAIEFLSNLKKSLEEGSVFDKDKDRYAFNTGQSKKLGRLIAGLDASVREIAVEKLIEILSSRFQEPQPTMMQTPQFNHFVHHTEPAEPDAKSPTPSSPRDP